MSETYNDIISVSRSIAAKLYYEWLKKHDLLELFTYPTALPSVFYSKRWVSDHLNIVEKILNFLTPFNIVSEAGGIFTLNDNLEHEIRKFDKIVLNEYSKHPSYLFIKYGLKLLDGKLEGDAGNWDINRNKFLFEQALTQPSYQLLCRFMEEIIDVSNVESNSKSVNVYIVGSYIGCFISSLAELFSNEINLTVITTNKEFKTNTITYCELSNSTAKYSNRIFTAKEFKLSDEIKADLVFIPSGVGFNSTFKAQLAFINQISRSGTMIYLVAPTTPITQIGIEPLFPTHPYFIDIPEDYDLKRHCKAIGFAEPSRIGPFNLIFQTHKV